jgi:hypothetical protein
MTPLELLDGFGRRPDERLEFPRLDAFETPNLARSTLSRGGVRVDYQVIGASNWAAFAHRDPA